MKFIRKFMQYMAPSLDEKVVREIDRQSLRSIRVVSMFVLLFEIAGLISFLIYNIKDFDRENMISLVSVSYCILLCVTAFLLSGRMLHSKELVHSRFFIFKICFFVLFTVWAIFVDYRHYRQGDQMVTFFAVNLIMVCFVIFRPWLGAVLVGGAYAGLVMCLFSVDGAVRIQPLNFVIMGLISIACNAVRCHGQINVSTNTIRLNETNEALETASRRDGLTGLLNRLALEVDASKADGQHMTAYMIDVDYFKEINDHYGHAAGDAILRDVSETLKRLYPEARYYRYGGDEFLVLTYRSPEDNYGADTYDFMQEKYGVQVNLSIGNAQGDPTNAQELFDLISSADRALYITKKRTHSVAFGGHDRRKR